MRHDEAVSKLLDLYEGLGDEQLLRMARQDEDLTDVARDALGQVMRGRGLSLAAAEVDGDADEPDEAEDDASLQESERWLWTFADAFQAGEAIRLLDGAGIWHRVMEKASAADPEQASRTLLGLMLIVEAVDYEAAVALLRAEMGLFPPAEVAGAEGSPLSQMDGTVLLAMFDRAEALEAAEALGRAGISYWWRDGRQEMEELPDEETVAIEVPGERVREAQGVVEKRLAELG